MDEEPPPRRSLPTRLLRGLAAGATLLYVLGLGLGLTAMAILGERNAALNFGLFLPPPAYLLPLVVLFPFCLLVRPRLCLWHLVCVAGVLGLFMHYHWHEPDTTTPPDLVCITHNVAQSHKLSLGPFIRDSGAQVVALQDSFPEGIELMESLADWQKASVDQFVLLSRYPILQKSPVILPDHPEPIAGRFEVALPTGSIAIYNVRLPTPRNDLRQARYWLGRVRRDPKAIHNRTLWEEYAESLPPRISLLQSLNLRVQQEKLPYLVMGDFNTPSTGYGYRLLAEGMTDSFAAVGQGYGLTFPGDLPHEEEAPVAGRSLAFLRGLPPWAFQPWLRLDYIFAGKGFKPLTCRVEEGRASEHHAVLGSFSLVK